MLVGVRCLLSIAGCCTLFDVRWLLAVVGWSLCVGCCVLVVACRLCVAWCVSLVKCVLLVCGLADAWCSSFEMCCLLCAVKCALFTANCLLVVL